MKVLKKVKYITTNDITIIHEEVFEFNKNTVGKGKRIFDYLNSKNLYMIESIETIQQIKIVKFTTFDIPNVIEIELNLNSSKKVFDYVSSNFNLNEIISIQKKEQVI